MRPADHRDTARFGVSVAAHYSPSRVPFLARVLDAIAGWSHRQVHVTLVTNDLALGEESLILQCRERLSARGYELVFDRAHGMAHPWHLTWWHKPAMRAYFAEAEADQSPFDMFMYIEDDIVVSCENIEYFERYLPAAKAIGCLPGFLRFEKGASGSRISPDYRGYQFVSRDSLIELDGQMFVAPEYPYWAGFILDRGLYREYAASPWSNFEQAETMPQSRGHSCRVQSAWALTYESVPQGLPSRYIVPVDDDLVPLECCQVWHSANNYSVSRQHNFGTVAMDEIFQQSKLVASVRQSIWDAGAMRRRAVDKARRVLDGI